MTSIEWFGHEVYKAIELHAEGNISATILGIRIAEARHKAIEIYKTETASNSSKLEISDEEIEKKVKGVGADIIVKVPLKLASVAPLTVTV
jgi:hypothetical protein